MRYQDRIKNIPERTDVGRAGMDFYSVGHSDAIEAAAEIAAEADAAIASRDALIEKLAAPLAEMFSLDEALLKDIYGSEFVEKANSALAAHAQHKEAK